VAVQRATFGMAGEKMSAIDVIDDTKLHTQIGIPETTPRIAPTSIQWRPREDCCTDPML
jgi:hypothetical protein